MKKGLFIYNPYSGNQNISYLLDNIIETFQKEDILIQPYRTTPDNAGLSAVLTTCKFDFAVISGGDGTINHAANALLQNHINIPAGLIPNGTCNDLSKCLDISDNMDAALNTIIGGGTIYIDAGLLNGREYFMSTCAGGLFVNIGYSTDGEMKKNFGALAYYIEGLSQLTNINPFRIKLKTDNEYVEEDILLFIILNGKHGAGFSHLAMEADLSDGLMDIVLIKNCTHIDLMNMFVKVMNTDLVTDPNVINLRSKSFEINVSRDIPLTIDGEKVKTGFPLTIECIPQALEVFVG